MDQISPKTWTFRGLLTLLVIIPFALAGQPTQEQYAQETRQHQQAVAKDFSVFLNNRLSDAARIEAVSQRGSALNDDQNKALVDLVNSNAASPQIRSVALAKVNDGYLLENNLAGNVSELLLSTQTEDPVRRAAAEKFRVLAFSAPGSRQLNDLVISTYRKLSADEVLDFRREGYSFLVSVNDDEARLRLLRSLSASNDQRPLPLVEILGLLSFDASADDYRSVRPFLSADQPEEVRLQAIRILGADRSQRNTLREIAQNPQSGVNLQTSALAALNANYPTNFSSYSLPLLQNAAIAPEVKIFIVQTERFRRNENRWRSRKESNGRYRLDDFDQAVRRLVDNNDASLSREALLYVKSLQLE